MMRNEDIMNVLGLSEQEAKVYLAALELGEATILAISRKSGVKRTSIYNFFDDLKKRQILRETRKHKRQLVTAAAPHMLYEMAQARLREFQGVLPELDAIQNSSRTKPRVTFYEGIDGIKEIYADTLHEQKPILAWSDFEQMWNVLGKDYFTQYPEERTKRRISFRSILCDSPLARKIVSRDRDVLRQTKFVSSRSFQTEINIYGNKVALMSFRSQPAFAVLIEDAHLSETLRSIWQELWDRIA